MRAEEESKNKTFGEEVRLDDSYHDRRENGELIEEVSSIVDVGGLIGTLKATATHSKAHRIEMNRIAMGVTREELSELFTHLAFYAGWANSISAAQVAKQVYEERGA